MRFVILWAAALSLSLPALSTFLSLNGHGRLINVS